MIDPAMDRGGLKDSENAPNSFFPKINRTLFWRLGTDMMCKAQIILDLFQFQKEEITGKQNIVTLVLFRAKSFRKRKCFANGKSF